jgi:tetratricopeptide (TPR) repeat protein
MEIPTRQTILFLFLAILTGCNNDKQMTAKETQAKAYMERISQAFSPSAEDGVILSTISYLDNIIAQEGNKNIKSIFYNKAQLLYKLKRYDEALEVMYQMNDESYVAHIAALLVCLGRDNEAVFLLQNAIDANKKALTNASLTRERKNLIIQGSMLLYELANKPLETLFTELIIDKIITRQEADVLLESNKATKEIILQSMWG